VPETEIVTAAALPAGYHVALVSAVDGHENAVAPDTLDLVHIDRAAGGGTYAETTPWLRHR